MKKSHFFAMTAILAAVAFNAPSAFAFTTDSGNDTVISTGTPHLTDPDEQVSASFGLSGDTAEPSSYFTSGGGGSTTGSKPDSTMYRSGFSIEPDRSVNNGVRAMPQQ